MGKLSEFNQMIPFAEKDRLHSDATVFDITRVESTVGSFGPQFVVTIEHGDVREKITFDKLNEQRNAAIAMIANELLANGVYTNVFLNASVLKSGKPYYFLDDYEEPINTEKPINTSENNPL